jgi:alkanesulfonate monooxygenase SsuD/methylene tetrahydromethanopterin reductase-like flavin-dependent oxidoreductase (luciferase family)
MSDVPLSVLDLIPITSGSTAAQALRNSIDLARAAERSGYHRYWFAEHHLNPGVASTAPAVVIALVASATDRIRLGSAGVQLGHRTALSIVEEFGLIDALHPGRLDLGLGRSGVAVNQDRQTQRPVSVPAQPDSGLVVPAATFDIGPLLTSPRLAQQGELLQLPGARTPDFREHVESILALLAGTLHTNGLDAHATPGENADVTVWILGSSGGVSARVAGARGLRFVANYHVSPSSILDAVAAYRAAFVPSETLDRPYVAVSADVVVADDDATAQTLASGYAPWVRSIRKAEGAIPFPTAEQAAGFTWTDEDRALVADRVDTQFVGSPQTVVEKLRVLQETTGADELVITTITHDHADRVRSYELLAKGWATA